MRATYLGILISNVVMGVCVGVKTVSLGPASEWKWIRKVSLCWVCLLIRVKQHLDESVTKILNNFLFYWVPNLLKNLLLPTQDDTPKFQCGFKCWFWLLSTSLNLVTRSFPSQPSFSHFHFIFPPVQLLFIFILRRVEWIWGEVLRWFRKIRNR